MNLAQPYKFYVPGTSLWRLAACRLHTLLPLRSSCFVCCALLLSLTSAHALATGTTAGTLIQNEVTLSYELTSNATQFQSVQASILVEELIIASLQSQNNNAALTVSPGQQQSALLFKLSNNGNSEEGFVLKQQNVIGNDQFDILTASFDGFYIDTDQDGLFDPNIDTQYNNNDPVILAADASLTFWAASKNFPTDLNEADSAEILVTALANTFSQASEFTPQVGDVIEGATISDPDTVYGSTPASTQSIARYVLQQGLMTVSLDKKIIDLSDTPTSGTDVIYQLTVKIEGQGEAKNLSVSDPLPSELRLKLNAANVGIITVDGQPFTSTAGDDMASYDQDSNTINIIFPTISAGIPGIEKVIEFTTVIQ